MIKMMFLFLTLVSQPIQLLAVTCGGDLEKQGERSLELQTLKQADQKDRKPPIDWKTISVRDETRRKRVAEIFAEGCITTAKDYMASALIFQHGTSADHFFQTFLWAMRAYELGAPNAKHLMALGIDRYLVNKGQKQLFGSQAFKLNDNKCWCLDRVEETFPRTLRQKYFKKSIQEQLEWIKSMNNKKKSCTNTTFCSRHLSNSPVGSIPGFW